MFRCIGTFGFYPVTFDAFFISKFVGFKDSVSNVYTIGIIGKQERLSNINDIIFVFHKVYSRSFVLHFNRFNNQEQELSDCCNYKAS